MSISRSRFHQIITNWIVLKSTKKGLLKNVYDGTSRCFRGREFNKTKVEIILWDTLHSMTVSSTIEGGFSYVHSSRLSRAIWGSQGPWLARFYLLPVSLEILLFSNYSESQLLPAHDGGHGHLGSSQMLKNVEFLKKKKN